MNDRAKADYARQMPYDICWALNISVKGFQRLPCYEGHQQVQDWIIRHRTADRTWVFHEVEGCMLYHLIHVVVKGITNAEWKRSGQSKALHTSSMPQRCLHLIPKRVSLKAFKQLQVSLSRSIYLKLCKACYISISIHMHPLLPSRLPQVSRLLNTYLDFLLSLMLLLLHYSTSKPSFDILSISHLSKPAGM